MSVIDGAHDLKIVGMQMVEYKFQRLGKMKAIRDDELGVILINGDHNSFSLLYGVNLNSVYYDPDFQEA